MAGWHLWGIGQVLTFPLTGRVGIWGLFIFLVPTGPLLPHAMREMSMPQPFSPGRTPADQVRTDCSVSRQLHIPPSARLNAFVFHAHADPTIDIRHASPRSTCEKKDVKPMHTSPDRPASPRGCMRLRAWYVGRKHAVNTGPEPTWMQKAAGKGLEQAKQDGRLKSRGGHGSLIAGKGIKWKCRLDKRWIENSAHL